MRVVFFGTPEFAVPSLLALVGEGFEVAAVVTRPDKPQGRSRSTLVASPVKTAALEESLPVLQPERPKDPAFIAQLRRLAPDVGVVVAYGHILTPELLAIPRLGMVNVHPSLLPALRGAAPIEWAILNGLPSTGVTIMQMEAGLDSGPILHQIPHTLSDDVTGGELTLHLAEVGAQALIETLAMMAGDGLKPVPQHHDRATYAPKLTRETGHLTWDRDEAVVRRTILALDPKPGAWTTLEGLEVKLFGARPAAGSGPPGEVLRAERELVIAAGAGALSISEVQPAGKPRLSALDWIRGRGVRAGQRMV
ncbi:MAG TPA: methionyl-tRNA formyltransferase [Gemmatimonadales bacterium]|nr:methionyl-tRNA formyltransferase [Gemmatimonadales bacterium]